MDPIALGFIAVAAVLHAGWNILLKTSGDPLRTATVGMVVITADTKTAPQGVRDSKLLTPEARNRLAPKVRRWAMSHSVGHASPDQIHAFGPDPLIPRCQGSMSAEIEPAPG